jgi:2-dehydro-3-deoxygluconokinase
MLRRSWSASWGRALVAERLDVLALGEPLISLSGAPGRLPASPALRKSVGGTEANVAIGLARLGLRVGYASRVGSDPFGDEVVRTLRGEGVDVSLVDRSTARPTGVMIRELRGPDDVHVYYYRHGSAVTELDGLAAATPQARHVHVSGITLVLGDGPRRAVHELLARAREWGATVSFDPNFRLKLCTVEEAVAASREVLGRVDDLLLSEAEASALTGARDLGEAAARLIDQGVARVVVRRGAQGALGVAGRDCIEVEAAAGPVVDCVGGGDGFTAGYLFERLNGGSFAEAVGTGAWVAALVVGHAGDYEGLPTRADYDAWRAGAPEVQR